MNRFRFDNGENELLTIYGINGYGDYVQTCIDGRFDQHHYRPMAVRVPFSLIGI